MNLFLENALLFNKQANEQLQKVFTPPQNVRHIPVRIEGDRAYARIFSHIEGKPEYQIKFYDEPEKLVEAF